MSIFAIVLTMEMSHKNYVHPIANFKKNAINNLQFVPMAMGH